MLRELLCPHITMSVSAAVEEAIESFHAEESQFNLMPKEASEQSEIFKCVCGGGTRQACISRRARVDLPRVAGVP